MKSLKFTAIALLIAIMSHAQEEISIDDYRFTMSASKAGQMELKLGELAVANGASPEIKMLGERMIEHHRRVNKELKKLADKRGIFLIAGLDEKQQKHYTKLSEKKGLEFDRALAKCLVRDHKDVIGEFQKEIKNGQDPELIIWAALTIPTIQNQVVISEQAFEIISNAKDNDITNAKDKSLTYKY